MISYRITSIILAVAIFLTIFTLVRRGKLQEKFSLLWFGMGILILIVAVFPEILDRVAVLLGVHYSPTLLFVVAIGVLLVQNLHLSITASHNEARIKELLQQVTVLTKLVEELQPPKKSS